MISYCIPVCNESVELKRLLTQLDPLLKEGDEIIIQGDQGNVPTEVVSVISSFLWKGNVTYIEYPLNSDFGTFKNNLLKHAKNQWVFQIDADELVSYFLLENIHWILKENDFVEAFAIPRLNVVKNITEDWIKKWGWNVTKKRIQPHEESTLKVLEIAGVYQKNIQVINFPDYQVRLFKNNIGIKWKFKVHELLDKNGNFPYVEPFPIIDDRGVMSFDYSLFHIKELDRQIKQNEFYSKIK